MGVFHERDPEYVAVILASTVGSRLYPLTSPDLPKHLLPLGGVPLLLRIFDSLLDAKVKDSVVCIRNDDSTTLAALQNMDGAQEVNAQHENKPTIRFERKSDQQSIRITVLRLSIDCPGSIEALRQADSAIPPNSNILVITGDLVVNQRTTFNVLTHTHRSNKSAACVMLLNDVGEQDENGIPLKESAKQKKGGLARDDEEVEYIALQYHEKRNIPRVVWKQSKIDVEQDEHMVGDTPKLVLPKARLRGGITSVRTEWSDVHVYVFSVWVRQLIRELGSMLSVDGDLVPLLISRQFLSVASTFGRRNHGVSESESSLELVDVHDAHQPFEVLAVVQQDVRRAFSVASYLYATKEFLQHAMSQPDSLLPTGSDIRVKSQSIILSGANLGEKVVLNSSIVGRNCSLGNKCRLNNVIVMDDAKIGDNVTLQNTIVGFKCNIGDMCSLKDCQVAPGKILAASTKEKGEAFVHDELLP